MLLLHYETEFYLPRNRDRLINHLPVIFNTHHIDAGNQFTNVQLDHTVAFGR